MPLPEEFRFTTPTVSIRCEGDAIILEPVKPAHWPKHFFENIRIDDPAFTRPLQAAIPPAPLLDLDLAIWRHTVCNQQGNGSHVNALDDSGRRSRSPGLSAIPLKETHYAYLVRTSLSPRRDLGWGGR